MQRGRPQVGRRRRMRSFVIHARHRMSSGPLAAGDGWRSTATTALQGARPTLARRMYVRRGNGGAGLSGAFLVSRRTPRRNRASGDVGEGLKNRPSLYVSSPRLTRASRCASRVPTETSQAFSRALRRQPSFGGLVCKTSSSRQRRLGAPNGQERTVMGGEPGVAVRDTIRIIP